MNVGRTFIIIGIVFIIIGLLWKFVGKLPGDILIRKENVTFYFPIMTSIIVSIILSLVFWVIGRIK